MTTGAIGLQAIFTIVLVDMMARGYDGSNEIDG
jgi:hypothetical protein